MEEAVKLLINELKVKIIDTLNFEDITPDDVVEDDQLVGGELGIDSIDVLELVMMIDKDYGIKIDNKELGEKVFANLTSLARFIYENSKGVAN
jgi:acyl carrier protein